METRNSIIKTSRNDIQQLESERRKIRFSSPKSSRSTVKNKDVFNKNEKLTIQTFRKDKPEQIAKDVLTM